MDITELAMMLESIEATPATDEEFLEAAERVKKFKLEDDQKLQLYGLYKQSTIGDINTPEPGFFSFVEKSKWHAWKAYEGFPIESARMSYVYIVNQLESSGQVCLDGSVAKPKEEPSMQFVPAVSTLLNQSDTSAKWSSVQSIFKHTVEDNILALEEELSTGIDVNMKNEEGMTPLHYAADRGFVEIARLLLQNGADKTILDADGQTALDYAEICEHEEIIALLSN